MSTFIKKTRTTFALLLWFTFVFLIAYFSPGRTIESNLTAGSTKGSTKSTRMRPASPAPSDSLSVDSDNDGIPDGAELQSFADRENFRRWFTGIAEQQFYQLSDQWNAEQRDCAGLVRFAWREALRRHDRAWFLRMGAGYEAIAQDVKSYNLENSPFGENFNTVFIGRDRRQAQPGDLLFFYQPWVQKFPYHVMIFLGQPRIAPDGADDWVVYHTGSSPTDQGAVKKVELSVLDHHPDPRWRPLESNRNFLGFYRLKILD